MSKQTALMSTVGAPLPPVAAGSLPVPRYNQPLDQRGSFHWQAPGVGDRFQVLKQSARRVLRDGAISDLATAEVIFEISTTVEGTGDSRYLLIERVESSTCRLRVGEEVPCMITDRRDRLRFTCTVYRRVSLTSAKLSTAARSRATMQSDVLAQTLHETGIFRSRVWWPFPLRQHTQFSLTQPYPSSRVNSQLQSLGTSCVNSQRWSWAMHFLCQRLPTITRLEEQRCF